jgi:hypothetical protein
LKIFSGDIKMSNRINNSLPVELGVAWNQKYSVADATAILFLNVMVLEGGGTKKVIADYNSATVFSTTAKAACIDFPLGSEVFDIRAKVLWRKTAAAGTDTWCYSATMT